MKKEIIETEYGKIGWYLTDDNNTIVLTTNKVVRKELKETLEKEGFVNLELPILNDIADYTNGGIVTTGDSVGQMTEAILFANASKFGEKVYSDINYYQIRSYINDLIEYGEAKFYAITEFNYDELTYLRDVYEFELSDDEMIEYWGENWENYLNNGAENESSN